MKYSKNELAKNNIKGKSSSILLKKRNNNLFYYHKNRHYIIYRKAENYIEVIALYHDRMDIEKHVTKLNKLIN